MKQVRRLWNMSVISTVPVMRNHGPLGRKEWRNLYKERRIWTLIPSKKLLTVWMSGLCKELKTRAMSDASGAG